MALKRIDLLIDECRIQTSNTDFSDTSGISDEQIISYINRAQERLQSVIFAVNPEMFLTEATISVTANTNSYSIPSLTYIQGRVQMVEYSPTGTSTGYYQLDQAQLTEKREWLTGEPTYYIRRGTNLLIYPIPQTSSGVLKITYQKTLPKLDIRRGVVGAVTLNSSNNTITALTMDTSQNLDTTIPVNNGFITIVDKYGTIKMRGIPISAINETSGVVTLDTFTYQSGESISVGDYMVTGNYHTTHSELADICERYLVEYACWKIYKQDSNIDSGESSQELLAIEKDIVDTYSKTDNDIDYVPVLSQDYLYSEI